MNNTMRYKGYLAAVDTITFHGTTVGELRTNFHSAIDPYLEDCRAAGRAPGKTASGKMMLRVSPELHAAASIAAQAAGKSLNQWAADGLAQATQE
jgi:predicted HicB family RNase H-like nuclease